MPAENVPGGTGSTRHISSVMICVRLVLLFLFGAGTSDPSCLGLSTYGLPPGGQTTLS